MVKGHGDILNLTRHALKALEIPSASILGWKIEVLNTKDSELQKLIGFDQAHRYVPEERGTS